VVADLVELDAPPIRAALGADAHSYLTTALEQRISGYARDRSLTADTAFATAPTG
jgi:hypothetical protein